MKYRRSAREKKEGEEKAFSSMTKRMDLQPGESSERSAREGEKRIAEKRRGIFVRKWHGFPGFGISIRNIGRRWLEGGGTAPRNLEFPLVIKSYPLQSGNTRHCRCCGRREQRETERRGGRGQGENEERENFARRREAEGLKEEDGKVHGPVITFHRWYIVISRWE